MQDLAEIHQQLASERGAMTVAIGVSGPYADISELALMTHPVMLTDPSSTSKIAIG